MKYLTISQAADAFGYRSPSTLRTAAQIGALRHSRLGPRAVLTTSDWVWDWILTQDGRGQQRGQPRSPMPPAPTP